MKDYPFTFLARFNSDQRNFIRRAAKKFKTSEAGIIRLALLNLHEDNTNHKR